MSSERARPQTNLVGWLATSLLCAAALVQGVALFGADYDDSSCSCKGEKDGQDVAVLVAIAPRPDSDWEFQPKSLTPTVEDSFTVDERYSSRVMPGDAAQRSITPRSGPPIYRIAPSNSPPTPPVKS